jgi:hypothetical protein
LRDQLAEPTIESEQRREFGPQSLGGVLHRDLFRIAQFKLLKPIHGTR